MYSRREPQTWLHKKQGDRQEVAQKAQRVQDKVRAIGCGYEVVEATTKAIVMSKN